MFRGETVTLSCEVEGGSAGWRFKQYRDGREEAGCSDQYSRRYGDSCTISNTWYYNSGVYWCESASGQKRSNAVNLTVSYEWVILQTPPQPMFEGDSLNLRCRIYDGHKPTRVVFYKDNKELQSQTGTKLGFDRASKSDEGSYKCRAWWSSQYVGDSAEVRVSVRALPKPALNLTPAREILEGDTVTLSCSVQPYSTSWRYLWYKDRQGAPVYQTDSSSGTGARYTISAAALNHSGEYWCRAGRGRNTFYSEHSDPIWVNVTALFSRVTLTASPGATVKEGEALNLTCEAAVNKTPRPELHYTIVRDGEPVTNSTDSALYSIASTEKSHTGNYTCAVESQGVRKSSQELHIELQTSWHSAAAAAGFSVSFFVILLIVFTLLLLYHKIRGFPCITGGKRRTYRDGECGAEVIKPGVSHYCHRERSDQNQDQAAGGVELSSRAQQPDYEEIFYCSVDTSKQNKKQKVSSEFEEVLYCNIDTSKHKKKKVKPAEADTVYSAVKITAGCISQANPQQIMQRPCMPQSSQRRKGK
ncbi:Fc receptor-like protein 6 isoform X2 [Acipenser ruthenus]|uniref:Fc receptor-like protein 6 isoform X2 n=1 Tax=Acipenser ruthenus TaxID=7906 RepID=UPI0027405E03|nr:Fc receptor-like protein 6 isoform X2 [Acipenser ruthenus]